ncbi:hypothetical protein QNK12_03185 [Neobacillus cucumis]|nr:hypothetical protein QNK12_03185 [Neobacillus cucumis]
MKKGKERLFHCPMRVTKHKKGKRKVVSLPDEEAVLPKMNK